MSLAAANG